MGFSKAYSAQTSLLKAQIIDIEVDISNGLHSFSIVGLPDKAVEEARDRISAAIKNSGFDSPKSKNQKIVISLAPADIKKEGPFFDLGMAIAYLKATGELDFNHEGKLFLGELSLDGELRKIHGTLALAQGAKKSGFNELFVPLENADEAALIEGITVYGIKGLKEVVEHLKNREGKKPDGTERIALMPHIRIERSRKSTSAFDVDLADIKGQETAKRGLEIAAAGGHNIAMFGPPGTGKTMLAKAFAGLLPDLAFEEALEVTSIHSVAGTLKETLMLRPPIRSPHHTSSHVSLVGGGANLKPGEITLAHKGVLFLDEFPEFDIRTIEALRQPLENGIVSVSRAKGTAHFPAQVILIAAMNPCPCGFYGFKGKECVCSPASLVRYRRKLSGPIVDRIDLWVEVGNISHAALISEKKSEGSESVRERIQHARELQNARFSIEPGKNKMNSSLTAREIITLIKLDAPTQDVMNQAAARYGLSARSYHRILKVARTIADLDGSPDVRSEHVLEAFQYRPKAQMQ